MLLDQLGHPLPGLGALRWYGGGETTVDASWSTTQVRPYRSHGCSLIQVLSGSAEVEVEGRWWRLDPEHIAIIPCRRLLRRRTTGMHLRWLAWGAATIADDLRLGSCEQVILVETATHLPWCHALACAGQAPQATTTCSINGVLLQASAHLLAGAAKTGTTGADDPLVDAAIVLLDRSHPRPLPMATLARALHCSTSLIHARFAAVLGLSPGAYARERRLAYASELLLGTDFTISDIAHRCGFNDPLHFSRVVRQVCGLAPVALRQRLRQDLGR